MEQQPIEVQCLDFHSKCYAEMISVSQLEVSAMKHIVDIEMFSANVSSVGTDLNSFAKFEEGLPRQVWNPGLKRDKILL